MKKNKILFNELSKSANLYKWEGKKMEEKNMEYPFHIQAVGFSGFFSRNLLHFAFYLISQPIENVGFEPQV